MSDVWQGGGWTLYHGDCLDVLRGLDDESVDSVVTDPPYGLSFMGKNWDHGVPGVAFWLEALRVVKPGGHLLAFGGTRTYHRLTCAIEDAGFEIRDCVMWVYGSGFPKSLDVSKAIDKAAGAKREKIGPRVYAGGHIQNNSGSARDNFSGKWEHNGNAVTITDTAPATDAARQWSGWGTALKPAYEPVSVSRKPLGGTVADNVLKWGTGAINVDGCRITTSERLQGSTVRNDFRGGAFAKGHKPNPGDIAAYSQSTLGRWPANLIHDGSEEATEPLGEAARFFYCAKASKRDRDEGLEQFPMRLAPCHNIDGRDPQNPSNYIGQTPCPLKRNHHPTVKPTDLMRYICRLVTPPGGVVLDPFAGSGSTGKGALLEGFQFIGIERERDYCEIAAARLRKAEADAGLFKEAEVASLRGAGDSEIP